MESRTCDAHYAHREWPLTGRCPYIAIKRAPHGHDPEDPYIYGCGTHVAANPWELWEDIPKE
jgi:hypothetical protein